MVQEFYLWQMVWDAFSFLTFLTSIVSWYSILGDFLYFYGNILKSFIYKEVKEQKANMDLEIANCMLECCNMISWSPCQINCAKNLPAVSLCVLKFHYDLSLFMPVRRDGAVGG